MEKTIEQTKKSKILNQLQLILSSEIWSIGILAIGFLGWLFKLDVAVILIIATYLILLFVFCDDVKNILTVAFAVPFFITTENVSSKIIPLIIALSLFLLSVIYYIVKQLAVKKVKTKKGKLFWAMVVYLVAHLLGGIIGHFNILHFLIILGMVLITYLLYWIAINFAKDLKLYMQYLFIAIGIVLSVQLLICYIQLEEAFRDVIFTKSVVFVGVQNINVAAIYFVFAMISVFTLGMKKRLDFVYLILSTYFVFCTYFTYSRMGILTCVIIFLILFVYMFVHSQNKMIHLIVVFFSILIVELICLFCWDDIYILFESYLSLGFSGNGRDVLWPWCFEKFIENPVFGVGFVSNEEVPTMIVSDSIILAHNTILQYLTSLGFVGTVMMIYYHVQEYIILLKNFNMFKFMNLMQVMVITIFGITATKDLFIIIILTTLISMSENDSDNSVSFSERNKVVKTNKKTSREVK